MFFYKEFKDFKLGITKENIDIITPIQTHSNNVIILDKTNSLEADGIITDKKYLKIGIKTADCVPILIKSKNYIGAIHAGWRGLYNGIIKNAFNMLKEINEIVDFAFIGPSAKDCCYEVGKEFESYFKNIKVRDSKLFFDTQKEAINQLKTLNPNISLLIYDTCSICNKEIPSFRRNKTKERIITFIEKN